MNVEKDHFGGGAEALDSDASADVGPARLAGSSIDDAVFVKAAGFIAETLSSPSLSSRQIAQRIGVSRAVLYRSFAHRGGVKRYIDEARLDLATSVLQARCQERGIVNTTARLCGYESTTRFSRLFRARHHETPTSFVRRIRQTAVDRR